MEISVPASANLLRDGVAVIPTGFDPVALERNFDNTLQAFPEYNDAGHRDRNYVLGGFAALGNPGSFHNRFVRALRQWCMGLLMPLFSDLVRRKQRPQEWQLEQLFDRMLFRKAGVTTGKETWHRDIAPGLDETFGGWINLDRQDQYFSCVPGTHLDPPTGTWGFAAFKDPKAAEREFRPRARKITIPPGSIMIFYERMVHEVVGTKRKTDLRRLFLGWRLTRRPQAGPMIPQIDQLLTKQAVMPIKSGQVPPMFSTNHWAHAERIRELARGMRKRILYQKTTGKEQGTFVPRYLKSLQEYGLPMYPSYLKAERAIYRPGRRWRLLMPGRLSEWAFYDLHPRRQRSQRKQ